MYLTDLGIMHRMICPHTHHQNDVVERKHRHIVETALTMMSQASMTLDYGDYAVISSVYLINRLPSSAIQNEVPYQRLFHKLPDYKFLKVFGCACFPLHRPYNQHKLQPRSQECPNTLTVLQSHKLFHTPAASTPSATASPAAAASVNSPAAAASVNSPAAATPALSTSSSFP